MSNYVIATALAASLFACCQPGDDCIPGATRCRDEVAEICDADGSFYELMDCGIVRDQSGALFVCAFVDEQTVDGPITGHTCMPADEAGAGGAK